MKLPFLWITTAFCAGILLAGNTGAAPRVWLGLAVLSFLVGIALLWRSQLGAAWAAGLLCWLTLGGLAASLEPLAIPDNHVTRLSGQESLPDDIALRWRGRLRSDPARLPWGVRYEIDLEEVEVAGQPREVTGGLRVSHYRSEDAASPNHLPDLRAGDRVEALVRARPPRNFLNPGAFDARTHLAREDIHLTASLRSPELLRKLEDAPPSFLYRMARLRGAMIERLDRMFASKPENAAVLRAMLLGDRNFVDHELADQFQRTAVYHVLVVSGLHVAALAVFLFWLGRLLRMPRWLVVLVILAVLAAFVAVVEDRPPILRASLMAAVALAAVLLFRKVELLNTTALAAWLILLARPSALGDPSFQLSFLAAGMIGALALPWIARTSAPYRYAMAGLDDPGRDPAHAPRVAQLRLDARDASQWLAARLPFDAERAARLARKAIAWPCLAALRVWDVFLVSSAIQLGMLPVMALYFHRVSVGGVAANIPASLLSAAIVPVGFVALLASVVWESAAALTAEMVGGMVSLLLRSVEWFSRSEWTTWRVPDPPGWLVAAYVVTLALISIAARTSPEARQAARPARRWWVWSAVAMHAAMVVLLVMHPFPARTEQGWLEITTLDVGQGDSVFVAFPNGRTLLVDGGGLFGAGRPGGFRSGLDVGEQVVSPYLWSRGIQRLDAVALTHAHQDHLDGLYAVLENFRVGELWVTRDVDSPAYRELLQTAERNGARVLRWRRGQHFAWGDVSGLVLWPEIMPGENAAASVSNSDSLVLRLDFGGASALLAGDIEKRVEDEMLARRDPLDADFLKVPHHGSRTSTTAGFVAAVSPRAAAISLSATNPFGHPHADVLLRLQTAGAQTLRTDRDGAITFITDGVTSRVFTFAGSERTRPSP